MKNLNKYFYCLCVFLFFQGYFIAFGQLKADFSAASTTGCTPFKVQFKDLSAGNPTKWIWDFGNGTSSNSQNPVAIYSTKGTYTVRLIIKNASNKTYIEKKNYISVSTTPDAEFSLNKNFGCAPLQVAFNNNTNLFGAGLKSWLWDFGDGNTSNQPNPLHTYNLRGAYNVSLIAETQQGCIDTLKLISAVAAGDKPTNVSFKANPLDGCASIFRNFKDLSTGNINSWLWDFGDGGTDNTQNPQYHYTDTGWFSVKLVVGDNGCADSVQYNNYVHIKGPVAEIHHQVNCADPYSVNFYYPLNEANSWNWDYGDGFTSVLQRQIHTYIDTGAYTVKLTVSDGKCIDSSTDIIYIVDQNPSYKVIPSKNSFCKNDSIQFAAINYDSSETKGIAWSFDGGLTRTPYFSTPFIYNVYTQPGVYPAPLLYVADKENCYDTIMKNPLVITGPAADFINSSPVCISSSVTFSDNSVPYKNSPLKLWQWNYGDGDSVLVSSSPVNYVYPFPGLYNVLLKVTDTDGCTDTISHTINISDTPVVDAGKDTFICAGKSVTLQPSGAANYTWSNSPYLNCTNCTNPVAAPADTTTFYVTGKNAAGCASSDSIKINVQQQEKITAQPIADTICVGSSVQLFASGSDSYTWQPSNSLSNPDISNPIATPQTNTTYTVKGSDKNGCFSSTVNVTIVAEPKPSINIIDSSITLQPGEMYQLKTTYSPDVIKWQWQPAQWLSDSTIANPVAQPQQNVIYTVTAQTANGCTSTDEINISVVCNSSVLFVPNTFSPNNDGVNDYFYPRSSAAINIKSMKIFNRWGQEIFKKANFFTNDQSSGWDGKYKGTQQQSDVYIYVLQINCSNGNFFTKQGSISLIR